MTHSWGRDEQGNENNVFLLNMKRDTIFIPDSAVAYLHYATVIQYAPRSENHDK